jgi:hypothetical protein
MVNKSVIDDKTRQKLLRILKGIDYRKIVSERARCHPNTVANVLNNGTANLEVETALLELAKEVQESISAQEQLRKKAIQITKQL